MGRYCAESWHFCNRLTGKLEKLNGRVLHFVYQDKISTYDETLVVKNGYTHEQIKELQKCQILQCLEQLGNFRKRLLSKKI